VNNHFLYKEDLAAVLPDGLSRTDSVEFVERYVRGWLEETLLYDKAEKNIPDNAEIDKLVENYRKALIMHIYQQALISQQVTNDIPEQEIADYYERNKQVFRLTSPMLKGLFIKVPLTAPRLNDVRRWYKARTPEAVDHLEKYNLQNGVKYAYFYDHWIPATDVVDLLPLNVPSPETYVGQRRQVELKDTAFYYFLDVSDYRGTGEEKPYEAAQEEVKELLVNQKRVRFMDGVKEDLYQQAVKNKEIIYNN
jgi:hypothetical protein